MKKLSNKQPVFLYLMIPVLAILACNAPIEEIFPAETPTVIKATIGPPPTLTPITLEESEYIIVTETPDVSATLTPTDLPPVPTNTPTPEPTATLFPTVTLNPIFENQEEVTPQAKNSELIMGYSIEWSNANGGVYQPVYYGEIVLVAKGGAGDYRYFNGDIEVIDGIIPIAVNNCEEQFFKVNVQSGSIDPVYRDVTIKAPCVGG